MAPLVEELRPPPDPVRCCELLDGLPYRLFLDSAAREPAARPLLVPDRRSGRGRAQQRRTSRRRGRSACDDARSAAGAASRARAGRRACRRFRVAPPATSRYDWGLALERLPAPRYDDLGAGRRRARHLRLGAGLGSRRVASVADLDRACPRPRRPARRPARSRARGRRAGALASRESPAPTCPPQADPSGPHQTRRRPPSYPVDGGWWDPRLALRSSFTHAGYLDAVARVREYIFAGDIFQANLSQRFEAPLAEPPWALYRRLRTRNPAPVRRVPRLPGRRRAQRVARALPARGRRRPRRDAADQGHAPARRRPRARRRARPGAHRERQGPRREPDDRGPDAQRSVARLRAGHRARARALRARALRHRAPPGLDRRRRSSRRAPTRSICCAPPFPAARSPARRSCARWRSSPSSSRRGAASTAARSATGASPASSTPASPSAPRSRATAAYTSVPAAASSPTPIPRRSTARRSTRPAA